MDPIGGLAARHAADAQRAERRTVRERHERGQGVGPFRLLIDQTELDAELSQIQHAEAPRKAEGNAEEASHEDRQSHNYYDATGAVETHQPEQRSLDLEV